MSKEKKEPEKIDIAIIGGGIAGLYSSYRLLEETKNCKLKLFEKSANLGGRILTEHLDEMPMPLELGPMRIEELCKIVVWNIDKLINGFQERNKCMTIVLNKLKTKYTF
ncbi:MAG: NAD(P)-binding protein [Ignavibacteria bacterium]|nr:NAD(P)-binding protein [Ignavibacteria bacterium]